MVGILFLFMGLVIVLLFCCYSVRKLCVKKVV